MPRLPSAEDLGQRPDIAPVTGGRAPNTATSTEALVGQSIAKFGDVLTKVVHEHDTLRSEDAITQLREKQLELTSGEDGFVNKKSADAVNQPLMQDYGDRLKQSVDQIAEGLGSDNQRDMFRRRAEIVSLQLKQDVLAHVTREKNTYSSEVYKNGVEGEINTAISRYQDQNGIGVSMARIDGLIDMEAKRSGWAQEKLEATRNEISSKVHAGVIDRFLASQDDLSANAYYEKNKDAIVGTDAARVERALEVGNARAAAQRFADEVTTSNLSEAEAVKQARQKFSGKQEDAAVLEVKTRFRELAEAINHSQTQAADTAYDIFAKTKNLNNVPPAVLDAMDGKVRLALEREAQSIASGSNIKTDSQTYDYLTTMASVDPNKFEKEDLRKYWDKLNEGDRRHLRKLQLEPDSRMDTATLKQQLAVTHGDLKWGSSESDKNKKAAFDKAAETAVNQAQLESGKKLNQEQRQAIIDRMLIQGEVKGGALFGLLDPDKRYFQVYGTEDAKRFTPFIPSADRKTIADRFAARGKKPTDEEITQAYRNWKGL